MEPSVPNNLEIKIYADPKSSTPTMTLPRVPWYAGITALQAMIVGEAMHPKKFSFRVVYNSIYGAFIDSIDNVEDKGSFYWVLSIDNVESKVGASEAIIWEDAAKTSALVEWRYKDVSAGSSTQAELKSKSL